ncbi:hypothetical protein J4G08_11905 [Candidatus Poribacteria bacterium]|nr:hypothetical protein [Candidatus Poribacteria bacterium]
MDTSHSQKEPDFARSPADKILFLKHVQSELGEIREEVEETCAVTTDVIPVPEQAYNNTLSLMEQMPDDIPMPDMMWLEDGGIGLEWRPGEGIATISLYGDGNVIYGIFFSDKCETSGICALSNYALLHGFLTTLSLLFQ